MKNLKSNTKNTGEFVRDCAFFLSKWNSRKDQVDPEILKKDFERIAKIATTMQMVDSGKIQAKEVGISGQDSETIKDTTEYLMALAKSFRSLANLDLPDLADIDLIRSLAFHKGKEINGNDLKYYTIFPKAVHLETQAICNAKCSFCPYTDLTRKGERMSLDNIFKIIQDLKAIPVEHSWYISPYKVNEPFLDDRLDTILAMILFNLSCNIKIISNGNYMPDSALNSLIKLDKRNPGRLNLTISLNTADPDSYKKLMKMSLDKTIRNLDKLHELSEMNPSSTLLNSIRLSSVATSSLLQKQFTDFVKTRYPRFKALNLHMNEWIADRESYKSHSLTNRAILSSPCLRWSDLSITSTGDIALCCMDADATYNLGNAINTNALDLYQRKVQNFLENGKFLDRRINAPREMPCSNCNYFQGGTDLYQDLHGLMLEIKNINQGTN